MKTLIRYFLPAVILSFAQKADAQPANCADSVRQTLKGARLATKIRKTRPLTFSDPVHPDTLVLEVFPGLLHKSQSRFSILSTGGKILYRESFSTYYFIRDIFQPDSVPTSGQQAYDKYINDYICSIPRERFLSFAATRINTFLQEISETGETLQQIKSQGQIVNKEVFREVSADPKAKIIWLPCFSCDEGDRYIGYSKKIERAVVFIESD